MQARLWCVVLTLACVSTPAAGQAVLSEADALTRLSTDSPRVREIRAAVELARPELYAAGRWPNPRVTFNREAVSGVTENMFTVTQRLPITGRRGLETSAASARLDAASARADAAVRRARLELRLAYADLVSAQARERHLASALDRLRELADVLARREAAGDAAGYDRLRAEREVANLESERSSVRVERLRAQGALAAFFPAPGDVTSLVAEDRPPAGTPEPPPVEVLMARAEMARGELAAFRKDEEAAGFSERATSRALIPEAEIVVGTKSSNAAGGDLGGVISVHATVPLFDRARPEQALVRARLAQAQAAAAAFRASLRADITAVHAEVIERRRAADRYRAAAGLETDRLERIAQVSYDAGERGVLELLDAYRTGAAGRVRQVALDAAARRAELELEYVSGWEMP